MRRQEEFAPDDPCFNCRMDDMPSVDTGLSTGAQNSAADRTLLRQHAGGTHPGLLRFWRSAPAASIGAHQAADRELRLDYCRERGIQVVRRPSGGGAVYLDPDQLGFSLIVERARMGTRVSFAQALERFGAAAAAGLMRLGIAAQFAPPNDLEIAGRKISSFFVAAHRSSLLLHGTVLLDADIRTMLEALRVPTEKLSPDGLAAARDRLVTVRECLGGIPPLPIVRRAMQDGLAEVLDLDLRDRPELAPQILPDADAVSAEGEWARSVDWSMPQEDCLEAVHKTEGGTLRGRARLSPDGNFLGSVEFSGDLHFDPADALARLAAHLNGAKLESLGMQVESFFSQVPASMIGFGVPDLVDLLHLLADKQRVRREIGLSLEDANALMVHAPRPMPARAILDQAGVMLVPYCAKPSWCKWRHQDGCTECGLCEVGEAYRMARERGMRVTSITNYEHLVATLGRMRADGEQAYVGMCCSHFFIKRHRAFRDAGLPAVLMDISGSNCYELQQEDQAYAGRFTAQATLNDRLLEQVMRFVPRIRRTER